MRITIIGAGGWGTALSMIAARNNMVSLWVYNEAEARPLIEKRENPDYLPGVKIPEKIFITTEEKKASMADLIIFAVPSKFLRDTAERFTDFIDPGCLITSAVKGFEFPSEKRISEVLREVLKPSHEVIVISGPSHAEEVARGVPTSIVAASKDEKAARIVQEALSGETFRLYRNQDVAGVEIAGAVKNVIAIAAGILRGLGLGDNTMAALMTRGLAEMKRLGIRLGAQETTFYGLAGIGDLIVTCVSLLSRNGRVGEELARGKTIKEIFSSMKMVAEGVGTVKTVVQMEKEYGIEMPISHAVNDIIEGNITPIEALNKLMSRKLKDEF
jgi:glycerol-3-phosphate dehydrogenase (NAD(P)+)